MGDPRYVERKKQRPQRSQKTQEAAGIKVPSLQSRPKFFETEQGVDIEQRLHDLVADKAFNTSSSYTPDAVKYPDNVMSFVEKHKLYIIAHPGIDPTLYVDNLRLKTRLRK